MRTEKRPAGGESGGATITTAHAAISRQHTPTDRRDIVDALNRRRAASRRLAVLDDGCTDPWPRHWPPLSLRSARLAWWHLADHDLLSEATESTLRREVAPQ